jgi:uncharacterized membrane protein
VTACLVLVVLAIVVASPWFLGLYPGGSGAWERRSLIGQTYGAVSAILSVFALGGVAFTLYYQVKETRRAVDDGRRQAMAELLRMAMDDPDLDACWGPVPDEDLAVRRQRLYSNMIVTQWGTAFRAGALPEVRLRANAAEMFSGAAGRAYWAEARESRLRTAATRVDRRFTAVLDEEYHRTTALDERPSMPASTTEAAAPVDPAARTAPPAPGETAPVGATAPAAPLPFGAAGPEAPRAVRRAAAVGFAVGGAVGGLAAAVLRRRGDRPRR